MNQSWHVALLVVLLTGAVATGISTAHVLGNGHDGISESRAIALAQQEAQIHDPEARFVAARAGRFDQFWYAGESDFAAPSGQRVWAIAFDGTFSGSCAPVPPAGDQPQCPVPNATMMVILDYGDGGLIEDASPIRGFEGASSMAAPAYGLGVIPEGTDFCPIDMYSQSGYLVTVRDASDVAGSQNLRPFLLAPAPAELAPLDLERLAVARSSDQRSLPPGASSVPLDLLAHDPALHSCDYHLEDKPLARSLRDIASDYLDARGIATREELAEPSVVWMISDSDLPSGALAAFALLQWPGRQPARTVVMTVFDHNWNVLGAVPVDLYAADAEIPQVSPHTARRRTRADILLSCGT